MARRRRLSRTRSLKKPASAFAPGAGASGKAIAWESLWLQSDPEALDTAFPTASTVGGLKFVTVMPLNATQGVVTLERVRGFMQIWWEETQLLELADMRVDVSLQLAPARAGSISSGAPLSVVNAFDLESNRIIWKKSFYPAGQTVLTTAVLDLHPGNTDVPPDLDIKSRRRFDRATWGMVLCCDTTSGTFTEKFIGGNMRALFRTSSGI